MSLEVLLKNLVDLAPKAVGAIIIDWEGEAVMEHCHCDPYDLRFIAAHKVIILTRIKEMQSTPQIGEVEDVVVTTSEGRLIIGCINEHYSLVMHLDRSCPVAPVMYHFRWTITELKKEI